MNEGLPLVDAVSGVAAGRLADVWVYLSASPLLGLTVTLLVYHTAFVTYRRSGFHPLANPVALSVIVLGAGAFTGSPPSTSRYTCRRPAPSPTGSRMRVPSSWAA